MSLDRFSHFRKTTAVVVDCTGHWCRSVVILKLDPNNNDSLSFVERENYKRFYAEVFVGEENIYGISRKKIIKFNSKDYSVSQIGRSFDKSHFRGGYHDFDGAVVAEDGYIYSANRYGQILKIDAVKNDWKIIGSKIHNGGNRGWGRPVIGDDRCIFFPPLCHDRVLKFNPSTQKICLLGASYGLQKHKWEGAVLASDGFIYCIPLDTDNILRIDSRHVNEHVIEIIDKINELAFSG